ncbi:RNA polymerase sigma factor [Pseudobacteroides cellulosolvens]|uniref:RNA polymerase, sigma-24 subunit, RpoE, ECF subfamily n=1 Tax=Pseudobacteroides cellulosolvens ATCC 35603 = DSM 2933 TaxID=398512 RepID=A0A0L6JKF7_9FIRM|nr:RNA polymerase sigma factor [Pseudobacteroides cellulosolvens]KNY26259.1 RNA polymerase, sigma-24 subunit, RpoE, ECF subfamily [Pseudobacteroides cellulosolvens ATCC 35603 = DSM 2933]
MEEEKLLVKNVMDGDMDSFSIIVNKYQDRLYRFLLGLTFCREDAEEILQDVFIRVYNYINRYNVKWSLSTWMHKIAVNSFKDFYKRKKKSSFIEYCGDFNICYAKHDSSLELNYESKELYEEVNKIICGLKQDYRVSLVLKCVQGFTYEEIGNILGISSVNAKIRVNRARQKIYEELRKRGG